MGGQDVGVLRVYRGGVSSGTIRRRVYITDFRAERSGKSYHHRRLDIYTHHHINILFDGHPTGDTVIILYSDANTTAAADDVVKM